MIAVTAALIGFFAFVIMRVTTPQMTTLFTDLSVEDSSSIIKDLEALDRKHLGICDHWCERLTPHKQKFRLTYLGTN